MRMLPTLAIASLIGACASLGAQTQDKPPPAGPKQGKQASRPHRPPPEALAACKAQAAGAACGFMSPHGAVKGSCWAPEGRPLACRPSDRAAGPTDRVPAGTSKASGPTR